MAIENIPHPLPGADEIGRISPSSEAMAWAQQIIYENRRSENNPASVKIDLQANKALEE